MLSALARSLYRQIPARLRGYLLMALLTLIWGSTFFLVKKSLTVFSPGQVVAARMLLAGLLLLPIALRMIPSIPRDKWLPLFWFGLIGNVATSLLFTLAQSKVDSAVNGMVNTLTPLMTLLAGVAFYRQTMRWGQVPGLVLGLGGALFLVFQNRGGLTLAVHPFIGFSILATMLNGLSLNLLKFKLRGLSAIQITAMIFTMIMPFAAVYLLGTDFRARALSDPDAGIALSALMGLAFFANVVGLILFSKLIETEGPVPASMVTYLMPGVSVLLGYLDLEPVSLEKVMALLVIVLGVWLANRGAGQGGAGKGS